MTLDEYLERFIEGYLFEDLRSMAPIKLALGQKYGAVGYPMVMTALSGIEVLGVLTSRAGFNPDNGAARFCEFWRDYVYVDRPAFQRLAVLAYEFVRHGLAHSFMTKPMVVVTKHRDPGHLKRRDDVLYVDALTLADDLEIAYFDRLKPQINGDFRARMETRFHEFREAGWQDREDKKHLFDKVPSHTTTFGFFNETTRMNSQSLPVHYSSNVLSKVSDDPNG